MVKYLRRISLLFYLALSICGVNAQELKVSGVVSDLGTKEGIPMVSVYFKGTSVGTVTGKKGEFTLLSVSGNDTIVFSSIGYVNQQIPVKNIKNPLEIKLKPDEVSLNEVAVRPDDTRVRWLIKQLVANKQQNNPDKHDRCFYEKYIKWEYNIANPDSSLMNSNAFKNHQTFFKYKADGSRYLPVYLSEQVVHNQVQGKPLRQKSTIIADKQVGLGILGDYEISGYTSGLDVQYNFYSNYVKIFEENFVSPAATNGWFYYNYYLEDSISTANQKQYTILFVPKRKHDKVFRGRMVMEDTNFSIVNIEATLSVKTNVNFLKHMVLYMSYQFVDGKYPFYNEQRINAAFDYLPFDIGSSKREMGLDFKQYASFTEVRVNPKEEVVLSSKNLRYESVKLPDYKTRDQAYWQGVRHIPLQKSDKETYAVIDSINNIPLVKVIDRTARMMMTGYYDVGKLELGPYMDFLQSNKIEGWRMFVGGRTSSEISTDWMLWGGLGYGTRTKKVSGSLGTGYKFRTPRRQVLKLFYDDRYVRMGENRKILYLYENVLTPSENNLVSAFLVRDEFNELHRQKKIDVNYEHEWRTGLSSSFNLDYRKQYSPEYYPFMYNKMPVEEIDAYEATLGFRFSFKEKVVDDDFMRLYISTDYPIINLSFTAGQAQFANKTHNYGKVHATIKHKINLGQTYFRYAIEGGAIYGKVPFTLLEIPRGNETYGYFLYDFNMVNYLEFAHDRYLHLYTDYHLNGFVFNRMPLLKNLGLREVFSAKAMVGSLSNKQYNTIEMPATVTALEAPYVELGAGLENIIRLFRIEAIWRVTPQSITGAPNFGVRAKFELSL